MSAPQNFRTAFNGFHREDVVRYLEYINARHTAQVNQLASENAELYKALESQVPQEDVEALRRQIQVLEERCRELEEQLSAVPEAPVREAVPTPGAAEELEAYRRAERTERLARERAELVYHQINGVLAEATARVDNLAGDIGGMADQVIAQLTQLQAAVGSSKQALKEAASIMYAIRPDNT